MRLVYEIGADASQLKRVLRGVEGEARASNRRVGKDRAESVFGPSRREAAAARKYEEQQARAVARAKESLDRQRSRAALSNIRTEERERIRAEQRAARAAESLDRQRARGLLSLHRATEREASRAAAVRAGTAATIRRGAAASAIGGLGLVGRAGGAALALAGGFGAAGALQEQHAIGRQASQLANQAGRPELKGQLARESLGVRGFTGTEALSGLEAFVTKTGNLDAARQALKPLSELSLATGANLEDLGQTAGQVFNVLKDQISDPAELMKELQMIMGTLAQQGSLGAVEIKDLAMEFGKLGAASRGFEGDAPRLLRSMGAFAQIAIEKGGASTSADAATAVGRLAGDIVTKKDKFQGLGVDIQSKTDKTKLRSPEEIMLDVLEKTGGDIMKTSGLFGLESKKVFTGMAATYSAAESRQKGSGKAAARAEFERYAGAASDPRSVAARAASRLGDDDMQLKETTKAFNAAVGEQLAPVATETARKFTGLIPQIAGMTRVVAKFAGFLLENPLQGVGLVVGAKIAKDIGAAGIGNLISGEIKGKLGAALGGLGAGLSVATMIVTAGILSFEKGEADIKAAGQRVNLGREAAKEGNLTALETLITEQEKAVDKAKEPGVLAGIFESISDIVSFKPYYAKQPGETNKSVAQDAADAIVDPNRSVNVKTQEQMLLDLENLRAAAQKAAQELNKVKSNGPEASRTAPMNSPSRG